MKFPLKSRKKAHEMALETAEQMLSNVFVACGRENNSVPLEVLSSYSNYRQERYNLQRSVIIIVLVLFLLLPLLFIPPEIEIAQSNAGSGTNPVYQVSVSGFLPIRLIQARMNGRTVPIYEVSSHEYMLQPVGNGELTVSATLLNRQNTTAEFLVNDVDVDAPVLLSTEVDGDFIHLYVSDELSGVDYGLVSVSGPDGRSFPASSFDRSAGRITIPYPESTLNVRIPDLRGNVLQLQLKAEE